MENGDGARHEGGAGHPRLRDPQLDEDLVLPRAAARLHPRAQRGGDHDAEEAPGPESLVLRTREWAASIQRVRAFPGLFQGDLALKPIKTCRNTYFREFRKFSILGTGIDESREATHESRNPPTPRATMPWVLRSSLSSRNSARVSLDATAPAGPVDDQRVGARLPLLRGEGRGLPGADVPARQHRGGK